MQHLPFLRTAELGKCPQGGRQCIASSPDRDHRANVPEIAKSAKLANSGEKGLGYQTRPGYAAILIETCRPGGRTIISPNRRPGDVRWFPQPLRVETA